jgi:hypothetical protein
MTNIRIALASGVYVSFLTHTVCRSVCLYSTAMSLDIFSLMSVQVFFVRASLRRSRVV